MGKQRKERRTEGSNFFNPVYMVISPFGVDEFRNKWDGYDGNEPGEIGACVV